MPGKIQFISAERTTVVYASAFCSAYFQPFFLFSFFSNVMSKWLPGDAGYTYAFTDTSPGSVTRQAIMKTLSAITTHCATSSFGRTEYRVINGSPN
jgi:hypothetical protein